MHLFVEIEMLKVKRDDSIDGIDDGANPSCRQQFSFLLNCNVLPHSGTSGWVGCPADDVPGGAD
jgi:hypothetical protein